ncbi:hypothetical protein [Rubritalea tangerina]|uniref:hypothetical protein n=1 Tax=Rubritalea tangerina TaxID=430798 RepID=UPI003614689F
MPSTQTTHPDLSLSSTSRLPPKKNGPHLLKERDAAQVSQLPHYEIIMAIFKFTMQKLSNQRLGLPLGCLFPVEITREYLRITKFDKNREESA